MGVLCTPQFVDKPYQKFLRLFFQKETDGSKGEQPLVAHRSVRNFRSFKGAGRVNLKSVDFKEGNPRQMGFP